jgi:hypothetical protein
MNIYVSLVPLPHDSISQPKGHEIREQAHESGFGSRVSNHQQAEG